MRKIIHIDMDCFFAAIEMRDYPHLNNKPIAVGGKPGARGVIATCNYQARRFGVRSAMPTSQALRLCPALIIQPGRMAVYKQESEAIRRIFNDYSELVEPLSLDEAFLDVSQSDACQGSATWMAKEIRQRIEQERWLTASAGIAPNKSLAKIASDWHKPNGQKVIRPDEVAEFILTLPAKKLFGVGPKMEQKLTALGIATCADLQKFSQSHLESLLGAYGKKLYELARGIDHRPVNPNRIRKSISVEKTFAQDLSNLTACLSTLPELAHKLSLRVDKAQARSKIHSLFVKIKFHNFQQTSVESIGHHLDSSVFVQLISEGYYRQQKPVRLIGLGVRLRPTSQPTQGEQLSLFDLETE